jgi:hypothetical protein
MYFTLISYAVIKYNRLQPYILQQIIYPHNLVHMEQGRRIFTFSRGSDPRDPDAIRLSLRTDFIILYILAGEERRRSE